MKRARRAPARRHAKAEDAAVPRGRLTRAHFEAYLPRLIEQLRKAEADRVALLPALFEGDTLSLGRVLDTLFPGPDPQAQVKLLTNLRVAVNTAGRRAGLALRFVADSHKRAPAAQRRCWFEGANPAAEVTERLSAAEVAITDAARSVVQRGLPQRRRVRYVFLYAEADADLANDLHARLKAHLAPSLAHEYAGWSPADVLAGEAAADVRAAREREADLFVVAVSPNLLVDETARASLAAARTAGHIVVPTLLRAIDAEHHDLGPLADLSIHSERKRAFAALTKDAARDAFALALSRALQERVREELGAAPALDLAHAEAEPAAHRLERHWGAGFGREFDPERLVRGRGMATRIAQRGPDADDDAGTAPAAGAGDTSVPAVDYILDWATNAAEPPFFALLGEYGMGKTTTCRLVTQHLTERRAADDTLPQPIYLDLRHFSWDAETRPEFDLAGILDTVLKKSYRAGTGPRPSAADVIDLVRERGALALCDGLDEVIVHMSPKRGRDFIRELWRLLERPAGERAPAGRAGKLLISCRSHYFRRVWEQNAMLLGEEREGRREQDYRALVLLPFGDEQIEEYLRKNAPALDVERALELIRSVHNLRDVAARPFTLSLLGEFLPDLERRARAGREIQGVDLYEVMVTRWLLRDDGKHHFSSAHKELLMERLAAALWASGQREWRCERLEDWLDDELRADERLGHVYQKQDREVLKEDLRTATFLVRPSNDAFRFAHTSLQEFFLARHLHRALREGAAERLALPMPTRETIDFLRQLLRAQRNERAACEATVAQALGTYRAQATELVLALWLQAQRRGDALTRPARLDLRGAQLRDSRFEAPEGKRLDLRQADLRGADLQQAVFERVDLSGADLTSAHAWLAEFHDVTAHGLLCEVAGDEPANFVGSIWRLCRLEACDLRGANLTKSQFIRCELDSVARRTETSPLFAACAGADAAPNALSAGAHARLDTFTGHMGAVMACAWSPDGQQLLSGSDDNTLRLWDASSGDCRLILEGHRAAVLTCAWSPNGKLLLSGSNDSTLRVWEASTGQCLITLEGYYESVVTCAWSPDGKYILSGSDDNTLLVWDASTGECIFTLEGHDSAVTTCAWSLDGEHLLSGSDDNTLRVWDASSKHCCLTLEGHREGITACTWSPDGKHLLSASDDNTLRVWDASSGQTLLTLEGHVKGVKACAWSPDGRYLLSGSEDDTLRVWDASSGQSLWTLEQHYGGVNACAWSPDGQRLLSGSDDCNLCVWDAFSGRCMLTLEGVFEALKGCAWTQDGEHLLSISNDSTLQAWHALSGQCLLTFEDHPWTRACAWSPDGKRAVVACHDSTLRIRDTYLGQRLLTLEGHYKEVTSCAWSPDSKQILSGSDDRTLCVWDAVSGQCLLTLQGHRGEVTACAWSPDSRRLLSGSDDNTLRVWDASSGNCLLTLEGHDGRIMACAWSPDGEHVLSGSDDNTLCVWDASSGACQLTLEGHLGWIMACAWSPDGRFLLSGSDDNTLRVWDASSGDCRLTLEGHRGWVKGCAWSPDGKRILSASEDNTLRIWDAATGRCLMTIARFDDGSEAVIDNVTGKVRRASPGAWRWLGWLAPDPATGDLMRYPAESFGPLPGAD